MVLKGIYINGPQSVVLRPATSALPGNLLEMQIHTPQLNLLNQQRGVRPSSLCLTSPLGDSDAHSNLRTTDIYHSLLYCRH